MWDNGAVVADLNKRLGSACELEWTVGLLGGGTGGGTPRPVNSHGQLRMRWKFSPALMMIG
jgi:hypothetical protein